MPKRSSSSPKHEHGSLFRSWLIHKLSLARFVVYDDDTDLSIAKRIGVQVDVLALAREEFLERVRREGLPEGQVFGRMAFGPTAAHEVEVRMPESVYVEWEAWRDRLRTNDARLFRSVIHKVLKSETQPAWVSKYRKSSWLLHGTWHAEHVKTRTRRCRLVCDVSDGAKEALAARGLASKSRPHAICRWGVCLLLAGKLPNLEIVSSSQEMYTKAESYCTRPRIT